MEGEGYHRFGWQGIELSIPGGWDLGAHSGDRDKGSFKVDDGRWVRLEGRWEYPKRAIDVERARENYVRALRRSGRRTWPGRQEALEWRDEPSLAPHDGAAAFRWTRRGVEAFCLIAQCAECKRLTALQVTGRPGENVRAAAARIFPSLTDHGRGGRETWAILGLVASVPDDYSLGEADLKSGRLWMSFTGPTVSVRVERHSLADVILAEQTLAEWAAVRLAGFPRGGRIEVRDAVPVAGHKAVGGTAARERGWRLPRRMPPACARAWHCTAGNKLYLVSGQGADEKELDAAVRVTCHAAGG
jgi:hypothetical protein